MLVSVDINRLKDHTFLVREELRVAQSLVNSLLAWRNQASIDGTMDVGFIDRHLGIARKQVGHIQDRITFLENAADKFSAVKLETADTLSDAKDVVTSSFF